MFKLPDWKNPSQYPTAGRASNTRFAWEFLRRNEKYQAEYAEYEALLRRAAKGDAELLRYIDAINASPENAEARWAEFDGQKSAEMESRLGGLPELVWIEEERGEARRTLRSVAAHLGLKWGLTQLANPAWPYDLIRIQFANSKTVSRPTSDGLQLLEAEAMSNHALPAMSALGRTPALVLNIDLSMPLEVIEKLVIDEVRRERALRIRKGYFRPHKNRARNPALLVRYLRILDGMASGANSESIGAELRPGDANVKGERTRNKLMGDDFKAACELRDEKYRVLPLLADSIAKAASKKK